MGAWVATHGVMVDNWVGGLQMRTKDIAYYLALADQLEREVSDVPDDLKKAIHLMEERLEPAALSLARANSKTREYLLLAQRAEAC